MVTFDDGHGIHSGQTLRRLGRAATTSRPSTARDVAVYRSSKAGTVIATVTGVSDDPSA
jgi:hypothetical protein